MISDKVTSPPKAHGGQGLQLSRRIYRKSLMAMQVIKVMQVMKVVQVREVIKGEKVKEIRSPNQEVLDQRGQDMNWKINR